MTAYEQGFFTKCAEFGVGADKALVLMKKAFYKKLTRPFKRWIQLLRGGDRELLSQYHTADSALNDAIKFYKKNKDMADLFIEDLKRGGDFPKERNYMDVMKQMKRMLKNEMNAPGWSESELPILKYKHPSTFLETGNALFPVDAQHPSGHYLWGPAEKKELKNVRKARLYTGIGGGAGVLGGAGATTAAVVHNKKKKKRWYQG